MQICNGFRGLSGFARYDPRMRLLAAPIRRIALFYTQKKRPEGRLDIDEYQHLHRFFIANKETIGSQRSPNTNHCRLWHCCNPGTMRIRQMLFPRNSQEWHMSSHNYNNNI